MNGSIAETGGMTLRQPDNDTLLVSLTGIWKIERDLPSAEEIRRRMESAPVRRVAFETREMRDWDSALLTAREGLIVLS
ncbi:MAG: hypothetical protein EHM27_14750 [Deltaproteobacteria bacterium]|nr:MAG: hypothetical protein EHM27_14750 [Deltaproteobacteria bacterium]